MLERFRSAQPRAQGAIIAGGALIVALILGAVWYFGVRTNYAPLFSSTRAGDAATIVAELDRQKIPYRLADGGTTILVPEDKVDATRLSVMSEDLPLKGTVGFELFNKSELGLTDFAQKINYQRALQGELGRTIMTLDGVEAARVHLALGEDRLFREDRTPPRASVTVRMRNGARLSDAATFGIQKLVAAAVPKLDIADVVVLGEHGDVISTAPVAADGAVVGPLAQQRKAISDYYEAQIRALLDQRYPGRPVAVAVSIVGGDSQVAGDALPQWNPSARAIPVRVVIEPSWPLDGQMPQQMRDLVAGAIGFDSALGDEISFGRVPRVVVDPPQPQIAFNAPVLAAANEKAASDHGVADAADLGLRAAGLVLGIAFVGFVVLRLGMRRPATEGRSPQAFADQLKAALAQENGHAKSDI